MILHTQNSFLIVDLSKNESLDDHWSDF